MTQKSTAKMRGKMKSEKQLLALKLGIFFAFILFICVSSSWAQSGTTGALTGTVVDAKGAAVPNVTVTLSNAATGQSQTAMTGANGLFGFSLLPPGTYEVDFSAKGFKTSQAKSVVVNVSEAP